VLNINKGNLNFLLQVGNFSEQVLNFFPLGKSVFQSFQFRLKSRNFLSLLFLSCSIETGFSFMSTHAFSFIILSKSELTPVVKVLVVLPVSLVGSMCNLSFELISRLFHSLDIFIQFEMLFLLLGFKSFELLVQFAVALTEDVDLRLENVAISNNIEFFLV
jgi:hypothetical protein